MPDTGVLEMTKEQLETQINDAVLRGVKGDALKAVVADAMKEYLDSKGARVQIAAIMTEEDRKRDVASPTMEAAKIVLDACDRAFGDKPRFGTDLDALRERTVSHVKRTGMLQRHTVGGVMLSRVGQTTSGTVGGYGIKTEEILTPIDLVGAPQGVVERCNNVPMQTGQITIVTLAGDITVTVTPETADASDEDTQAKGLKPLTTFTLGKITLSRYTITAVLSMTRQQMAYDAGYMETLIRTAVPPRIWGKFGRLILSGSGAASDYISGLDVLVTGANVVEWNDAAPFDGVFDLVYAPEIALTSEVAETDTVITGNRAMKRLQTVKDKNDQYILGRPNEQRKGVIDMWGYDLIKSGLVGSTYGPLSTATRMYAGDFKRHAHVGVDPSVTVLVNPFPGTGRTNRVEIIFEVNAGFAVSSASAFAYMDVPR